MMGIKLLILQFIVFLTVVGQFTTADKFEGIYPDVRNCFKGRRKYEDEAAAWIDYNINGCKRDVPDGNSVCFKYCVLIRGQMMSHIRRPSWEDLQALGVPLEERSKMMDEKLIGYEFRFNLGSVSRGAAMRLGVDTYHADQELEAEIKRVEELVDTCHESSFIVPKAEYRKGNLDRCVSLSPINQENLGKLISCLEDVLKEC